MAQDDEQPTPLNEGDAREIASEAARAFGLDEEELFDALFKRRLSLERAVHLARRAKQVKRIDPGDATAASAESTRATSRKER